MRAALCELHKGHFLRAFALERENGPNAVACVLDAYRSCHVRVSHSQLRALGLSYHGKRSLNVCRVHLEMLNAAGWRVVMDERAEARAASIPARDVLAPL